MAVAPGRQFLTVPAIEQNAPAEMPVKRTSSSAPKPPAVYGRPEKNARLSAEKTEILKKLDFRRDSVMRQRGFGVALAALGRNADALSVLDYAHSNVEYRGSADVWYAAGTACCIAGYLRRKEGDEARALQGLQRFIDPPCAAIIFQSNIWTADFVGTHLAQERAR